MVVVVVVVVLCVWCDAGASRIAWVFRRSNLSPLFTRFPWQVGRDGAKLVSLIDLGRKEWIEDSTEISTPANQSTISNYAADVCLRSGKWYWEFEMVAGTQFLGVGWVTREFQPTSSSSSGMNNSQNGSSWCAVGPSSVYWFSNRASEIVAPNQGRTSGPEASWTPGTVYVACSACLCAFVCVRVLLLSLW